MTAETTPAQSALRDASDLFCEKAEAEGWVSSSPGLLGLAAILMNGAGDDGEPAGTYADHIDAGSAEPAAVLSQIKADAMSARGGLITVEAEARSLLGDGEAVLDRADVTAFERALVRAQRSNRGFREALEIAADRSSETAGADASITAFEETIDRARQTADALSARYAGRDEATGATS